MSTRARHSAARLATSEEPRCASVERIMTAMECDRVEARHPAARLVFDDEASEVVTLTPSDDEEARASAREGPRVLTAAMDVDDARAGDAVKPSATTTTMFARLKNASLGDFFGNRRETTTHKRDRVASPAVKANRRKAADGGRGSDVSRIAREIAQALDEPKVRLLARAVDALGERACRAYASEARALQENGGEMTAAGDRKRTTGGLFWSIVRNRTAKETYNLIFAEERERSKIRLKARRARSRVADGKENIPPFGHAPTMAQILFGSIRNEHFPSERVPLAPLDVVTPAPTLKSLGGGDWADVVDADADALAAPMKPTRTPGRSFADIARAPR